jgi:capsular polysaccharide transport system permease protein
MSRGLDIMRRAVLALFLREIRTRFGKYQLGYVWALLEPVGSITVLLLVFTTLGAQGYPGITFPIFLATGVVVNSLFVDISNRSIKAMEANSALFNYRPIRPVDTVIARALLELLVHLATYAFLIGAYALMGGEVQIHNLSLLLLVFLLMASFSFGVGMLFMLVTDIYSDADKVLPLITRPIFFISGAFFSIQIVPKEYQPLLLWNPIFHAIELARESVSATYHVPEVSLGYLVFCTLFALTSSLTLYRRHERKMRLR